MVMPENAAPVSELLALCRRALGSKRHRYAIARPDKLETDPMVDGGKNKWTPPRKVGGIS